MAASVIAGQHLVAAEFRQTALRTPKRLALLDAPAGARGGKQAWGGSVAAAQGQQHGRQQPVRMTNDE